MDELDIFIGGQWRRGGGNLMHSQFPADGAINAALHAASLVNWPIVTLTHLLDAGAVPTIVELLAGAGENDALLRADALAGLEVFGIEIDAVRNQVRSGEARRISTDSSRVTVLVVPTNEELAIARAAVEAI